MRFFVIYYFLTLLLFVSCSHSERGVEVYKSDVIDVYHNTDESRIIGLSSLCVLKQKYYDDEDNYLVRFVIDDIDSSFFCVDLEDEYLEDLNQYLDYCSSEGLKYSEDIVFEINGVHIFNMSQFFLSCVSEKTNCMVDMRISPQKLKSIIEKAERIIAEEKKKDK